MMKMCGCHFCSPRGLELGSWTDCTKHWRVWIVVILLLSVRGSWGKKKRNVTTSIVSQPIHIEADEATDCGAEECYCYEVANCRPCSKLDIIRQLSECMLTAYKQTVYCPSLKTEKHISCHYKRDPNDIRNFLLFQLCSLLLATASYGVVKYRLRIIEQKIAKRIQEQINA